MCGPIETSVYFYKVPYLATNDLFPLPYATANRNVCPLSFVSLYTHYGKMVYRIYIIEIPCKWALFLKYSYYKQCILKDLFQMDECGFVCM